MASECRCISGNGSTIAACDGGGGGMGKVGVVMVRCEVVIGVERRGDGAERKERKEEEEKIKRKKKEEEEEGEPERGEEKRRGRKWER